MNKTLILEYLAKNKNLQLAIRNIVESKYRKDFTSHFYIQIANTKEDKLIDLYNKGQLDWFCLRVITNQYKSSSSTFWKLYKNGGFAGENLIYYTDLYESPEILEVEEDKKTEYDKVDVEALKRKVKNLLKTQYKDFYVNQYHKTLFELYYFDKKNLRQINELTNIKISTIMRSIQSTKSYIKNKLL